MATIIISSNYDRAIRAIVLFSPYYKRFIRAKFHLEYIVYIFVCYESLHSKQTYIHTWGICIHMYILNKIKAEFKLSAYQAVFLDIL